MFKYANTIPATHLTYFMVPNLKDDLNLISCKLYIITISSEFDIIRIRQDHNLTTSEFDIIGIPYHQNSTPSIPGTKFKDDPNSISFRTAGAKKNFHAAVNIMISPQHKRMSTHLDDSKRCKRAVVRISCPNLITGRLDHCAPALGQSNALQHCPSDACLRAPSHHSSTP